MIEDLDSGERFSVDVEGIAKDYSVDRYNPYQGWRKYQKEALCECIYLLENGYNCVLLDLPTGVGKSLINMLVPTILKKSAFYTTPQRELRSQLKRDSDLGHLHSVLEARKNYSCSATGFLSDFDSRKDCERCPYRRGAYEHVDENSVCGSPDSCGRRHHRHTCKSKYSERKCSYYNAKRDCVESLIATLTFAALIQDSRNRGGDRESGVDPVPCFGDRDFLVIDECHSLEGQVAGLFAGFSLSVWSLPASVGVDYDLSTDDKFPGNIYNGGEKISSEELLRAIRSGCREVIDRLGDHSCSDRCEDCEELIKAERIDNHIGYFLDSFVENEDDWVVDDLDGGVRFRPVFVGDFLNRYLWPRGENILLSTASFPFYGDEDRFLERIGLNSNLGGGVGVVRHTSPFPVENRKIHLVDVGDMSGGGFRRYIDDIIDCIIEIAGRHSGERGLIHSVSYSRGDFLVDKLEDRIYREIYLDDGDGEAPIDLWQNSSSGVLVSPRLMEGVDLRYDMCRWQVLPKLPYPDVSDSRIEYILDELGGWSYYNSRTAVNVLQACGRSTRAVDDVSTMYILDSGFLKLKKQVELPGWFEEALVY